MIYLFLALCIDLNRDEHILRLGVSMSFRAENRPAGHVENCHKDAVGCEIHVTNSNLCKRNSNGATTTARRNFRQIISLSLSLLGVTT